MLTRKMLPLLVLTLACGGSQVVSNIKKETVSSDTVPSKKTTTESQQEVTLRISPVIGRAVPVDRSETRWVAGGIRFEQKGTDVQVAEEVWEESLVGAAEWKTPTGESKWWFHDSLRRHIWKSDTFLGSLSEVELPFTEYQVAPSSKGLYLVSDGALYRATTGITKVPGLDHLVIQYIFVDGDTIVITDLQKRGWRSVDDGQSFVEEKPETATKSINEFSRDQRKWRRNAVVGEEVLAKVLATFPGSAKKNPHFVNAKVPKDCDPATKDGVTACADGVQFYSARMARWVPAIDNPQYADLNYRMSTDRKQALFFTGCGGQFGHSCLVNVDDGERENIPRMLTSYDLLGFQDHTLVYGVASVGQLAFVDLRTGISDWKQLDLSYRKFELRSKDLIVGLASSGELHLIAPSEVTNVALPGTDDLRVGMMNAKQGMYIDTDDTVLVTKDGGTSWSTSDLKCHSTPKCSNEQCSCDKALLAPGSTTQSLVHRHAQKAASTQAKRGMLCPRSNKVSGDNASVVLKADGNNLRLQATWTIDDQTNTAKGTLQNAKKSEARSRIFSRNKDSMIFQVCIRTECNLWVAAQGKLKKTSATFASPKSVIPVGKREFIIVDGRSGQHTVHLLKANGRVTALFTNTSAIKGVVREKNGWSALYRRSSGFTQEERVMLLSSQNRSTSRKVGIGAAMRRFCQPNEKGRDWYLLSGPSFRQVAEHNDKGGPRVFSMYGTTSHLKMAADGLCLVAGVAISDGSRLSLAEDGKSMEGSYQRRKISCSID